MNAIIDLTRTSPAMLVLVLSTVAMFAVAIGFLVAASWLRRSNNRKAAQWAELERGWGALIDLVAEGQMSPESLHTRVPKDQRLVFADYLYKAMQAERDGERRRLYGALAAPYLHDLRRRAERGDVWQRARALRTIADLVGKAGSGAIKQALDDPAPHVAMTAARTYARLQLGPIEPLLDRLDRYQEWDRRLLRLTLASFGDAGVNALQRGFADTTEPTTVRAVCADTLAELEVATANDTAIAVLQQEQDLDLRAAALRVLRAPASEPHRALVRSLCAAEDPIIRAQAVACLARIGELADVNQLEHALADISPWVVLNASRGLNSRRN